MTFETWIADPVNWVYLALGMAALISGFRVVTASNVIHAALYLVGALAASAGLFLLVGAEFVAWVIVLVYIGAVVVLFLFGIMITRAPTGRDDALDNPGARPVAGVVSVALFGLLAWTSLTAFGALEITDTGSPTPTAIIGTSVIDRFLIPFEVVGFILLAALIGGITLARRDLTIEEEEETGAV